jgi:hypothetical protein
VNVIKPYQSFRTLQYYKTLLVIVHEYFFQIITLQCYQTSGCCDINLVLVKVLVISLDVGEISVLNEADFWYNFLNTANTNLVRLLRTVQ